MIMWKPGQVISHKSKKFRVTNIPKNLEKLCDLLRSGKATYELVSDDDFPKLSDDCVLVEVSNKDTIVFNKKLSKCKPQHL